DCKAAFTLVQPSFVDRKLNRVCYFHYISYLNEILIYYYNIYIYLQNTLVSRNATATFVYILSGNLFGSTIMSFFFVSSIVAHQRKSSVYILLMDACLCDKLGKKREQAQSSNVQKYKKKREQAQSSEGGTERGLRSIIVVVVIIAGEELDERAKLACTKAEYLNME
ncbi:hypothetical protein ACJX0J_035840, partial [Zea mays]